jgi:predicted N-formylglutamate amidohydrolase
MEIVITCEHASATVPAEWLPLFRESGASELLTTHRGYDAGAASLATELGVALSVKPFLGETTRLLCDLNRSRHHPKVFSEFTRDLDAGAKSEILDRHWVPYREAVTRAIQRGIQYSGSVLHLSCHSFTPVLDGVTRTTGIGLLYDPARSLERDCVDRLQGALQSAFRDLRIHRNQPYRGTSDGFTTHLRKQFSGTEYGGIELELNQRLVHAPASEWRALRSTLVEVLATTICDPMGMPPPAP